MQVRATQRGFYGSLREVGDEFELFEPETDYAESWMTPVDGEAPKAAVPAVKSEEAKAPRYSINHVGGGNWEVLESGERVGEMYRKADGDAKEKAQAEADRLNAGGEPSKAEEPPPEQSEPETSDGLPDA